LSAFSLGSGLARGLVKVRNIPDLIGKEMKSPLIATSVENAPNRVMFFAVPAALG
jgi:hypothetical protein